MQHELDYSEISFLLDLLKSNNEYDLKRTLICIAEEINDLKRYKEFAHDLIPIKYKKAFPNPGENPFFNNNNLFGFPRSKDERKASLEVMKILTQETLEKSSASFEAA